MSHPTHEPTAADRRPGGPQTYATFRLGDDLFGTATSVVKEVTAVPPLTPIPHSPSAVRGYVNLRGHIVLVVDLNCLLQRAPTALGPESRLIVFKPELGDTFGILVERIGEIVGLSPEQIETQHLGKAAGGSELGSGRDDELICGVGKLDRELLSIVDAHRLRPCLELAVAARGANRPETTGRSGPTALDVGWDSVPTPSSQSGQSPNHAGSGQSPNLL
jgi:purine-binding chemotaxis protein CheW